MDQCLSICHLRRNTIDDGGSFVEMKLNGLHQARKDTIMLLWGMFLSEKLDSVSFLWIHANAWHEHIPVHTSNERSPFTFSVRRNYSRGVEGLDHFLETCSKVRLDGTRLKIGVNLEIGTTDAFEKLLDLTRSITALW